MSADPFDSRTRKAEPDDAAAIADLWLRSRRASTPAIPAPVHSDDEVRAWFASVVLLTRETWVVEHKDKLLALLVLDGASIDQVYVDPDHVGAGLGSRLIERAKELRSEGLDLWTFQANLRARRFYERHGFVVVATTDGDNEEGAPDVRYHWPET